MKKLMLALFISSLLTACTLLDTNNNTTDPQPNNTNSTATWPNNETPAAVYINGNLWDDMQDNLQLPDYSYRPEVEAQIRWYQKHQGYLNRIIKQSAPYIYYVYQQTVKRHLPAELALLPIIESAYNPFLYSNVGAVGLWQMMPGTATGFGLKINWWYDGRRDIVASTNAALNYLSYLNDFFTNDWVLAIAAYDCGEGTVQHKMQYNKRHKRATDFWALHLPQETKNYVPKILALSEIIRDPDRYNINLLPINDAPYLQKVNIGSQIDLAQAAKLAAMSITSLRKLNPGFRRWATDPNGPYYLLIPVSKAKGFMQRLNALPKSKRVTWREYVVRPGDTLGKIVLKYHTNLTILKEVNSIHGNMIKPGQSLIIPVSFHGSLKSPVVKEHATIAEEKLPGPHRVSYLVKDGDTLWIIAQRYGVKPSELRFWNKLKRGAPLVPGRRLLIWSNKHARLIRTHFYIYKVCPGDNLSTIAVKFDSSVKRIKRANRLKNNMLHLGQILKIPSGPPNSNYLVHTVKKDDNLLSIAHKFNISAKDLKKWNGLQESKYIHPGQKLYIYYNVEK